MTRRALGTLLLTTLLTTLLATCVRPADERTKRESAVGQLEAQGLRVATTNSMAAIRVLKQRSATIWAQAPTIELSIASESSRSFRLEVRNCMPDAQLTVGVTTYEASEKPRPTWCIYEFPLQQGDNQLFLAPPDWQVEESYKFADMGDIQKAMDSVDDIFKKISDEPGLRFVMSTGDVVQTGAEEEYELFQEQLATLDIPFFSTIGNHEITVDAERWHELFGVFSVHFRFKGVDFSFVDSGNASLDPALHKRLETWLEEGKDRVHIFGTHYPLFDPVGVRNAGFRSRSEASKLLVNLARGNVDLTLYGHVHSLYEFDNAGIPAYISGGGGALPERFDGIDRHFLVIEVDPVESKVESVEVVRVATP